MKGYYVIKVKNNSEVDVTVEGYSCQYLFLPNGDQVWWITWDVQLIEISDNPVYNKANGVLVVARSNGQIEVSNDQFGTTPVFYRRSNGLFSASNNFDLIAKEIISSPDRIGFWESVLFETPLIDRTLITDIKYLSAGTTFTIKPNEDVFIKRYWNYSFDRLDIRTVEECADICANKLISELKKYKNKTVILPVGGGVDSRLLAAALHAVEPGDVQGITYGYNKHILEYVYAKKAFKVLGWSRPSFHKLTEASYVRSLEELSKRTGSLIGMQNCHLFDCLREISSADVPVLSGMYSDAVCGWESKADLSGINKISAFSYIGALCDRGRPLELEDDILEGIYNDLQMIRNDWLNGSSIESFNEYLYVRERNAKFHLLMADSWREFSDVKLPFASYDVAMTFLSLPPVYREKKLCTFLTTAHLNPAFKNMRNVSSLFREIGLGSSVLNFEHRIVSIINRRIEKIFDQRYHLVDRAETENHSFNLKYFHDQMFKKALCHLSDFNICDERTLRKIHENNDNLPPFFRYQLISNVNTLMNYAS